MSKSFGAEEDKNTYERYLFNITDEDEQLELLPIGLYVANGFYKTDLGKKVFVFDYKLYEGTEYMTAWCYYNFASNLRRRKMKGHQYRFWRYKKQMEGKGHLLYD